MSATLKAAPIAAILFSIFAGFPAFAARCIATTGTDGTILSVGAAGNPQIITIHRGTLSVIEDCAAVSVRSGAACFLSASSRSDKVCVKVAAGMQLDQRQLGNTSSSAFDFVVAMLRGEPRTTRGGLRANENQPLPGFPYDDVLAPAGDLEIPTRFLGGGTVEAFGIENRATRLRIAAASRPGAIVIPARALAADQRYHWSARVDGRTYVGSFVIVRPGDAPDLAADLDAAARAPDSAGDPAAQAIARALILERHGFGFDASRVLASLAR